jgi:hypothetical protein
LPEGRAEAEVFGAVVLGEGPPNARGRGSVVHPMIDWGAF